MSQDRNAQQISLLAYCHFQITEQAPQKMIKEKDLYLQKIAHRFSILKTSRFG
jgi:hypothetical protein